MLVTILIWFLDKMSAYARPTGVGPTYLIFGAEKWAYLKNVAKIWKHTV